MGIRLGIGQTGVAFQAGTRVTGNLTVVATVRINTQLVGFDMSSNVSYAAIVRFPHRLRKIAELFVLIWGPSSEQTPFARAWPKSSISGFPTGFCRCTA